jgi:diguanylate cyclase (GGDEF)-like protein
LLGKRPTVLLYGLTTAALIGIYWKTQQGGLPSIGEISLLTQLIAPICILLLVTVLTLLAHKSYVAKITDATTKASEIHALTHFDRLTNLPNRFMLVSTLEEMLAGSRQQSRFDSLILLNVDRFTMVNDGHGRQHGDALLTALCQRIKDLLPTGGDLVARVAGDEFAILLHTMDHKPDSAAQHAMVVIKNLQAALREPFELDANDRIIITVSVGACVFPSHSEDNPSDVLRRADTALNRARRSGGAGVAFFDEAMGEMAQESYRTEQDLRRGIPQEELRLYLQSQVDNQGRIVGTEALVRWQHPVRGLLPPGIFVPMAEQSNLIEELDAWVMAQSLQWITRADMAGHPLNISVNISPRHFQRAGFVAWMRELLGKTGADPTRLTIEMTESVVMNDIDSVIAKMSALTALGIHFSMDDFGTGYSSLAYLKRLPIHELKIDKTFIQDAPTNAGEAALVETILSVAQHMHLKVVAEGVETAEQAAFLNARASIVHQGYLYGKPVPVALWMERWGVAA